MKEFSSLGSVAKSIGKKLTGKVAKDLATKAATKAIQKGSEQIGTKVGEKTYDEFANKKQKTINQPHNKGDEIIQLLKQHPANKKYRNDEKKPAKINII